MAREEEEQAQGEPISEATPLGPVPPNPLGPEFHETRLPVTREKVTQGELSNLLKEESDAFRLAYSVEHDGVSEEELNRIVSEHRAEMATIPSMATKGKFTRTFVPGESLSSFTYGEEKNKRLNELMEIADRTFSDIANKKIGLVDGFIDISAHMFSPGETSRDVEEMIQTGDLLTLEGDVKGYNSLLMQGTQVLAATHALVSGLSGISGKPVMAAIGQAAWTLGFKLPFAVSIYPAIAVPVLSEVTHPGAAEGNLIYHWYKYGPANVQNMVERNLSNSDVLVHFLTSDAVRMGVENPEQYFNDVYDIARDIRLAWDHYVQSRDLRLPKEEQERRKEKVLSLSPRLSVAINFLEYADRFPTVDSDKGFEDIPKALWHMRDVEAAASLTISHMVGDPIVEGIVSSILRLQEAAESSLGEDAPVFVEREEFISSIAPNVSLIEVVKNIQAVQEEPGRMGDLLPKIERDLFQQSYNSLPDELKKEPVPVERFKDIANNIRPELMDDPSFTLGSPSLIRAVRAVHAGKSNEEIQDLINEVSFSALTPMFIGHPETYRNVMPTNDELLAWGFKSAENIALVGGLERRKQEQSSQAAYLNIGEVVAVESLYGKLFRLAEFPMATFTEADLGMTGTPYLSSGVGALAFGLRGLYGGGKLGGPGGMVIGGLAGLTYSQLGTPAAMDFEGGYEIRDPRWSYPARVVGTVAGGESALTGGYQTILRESGYEPADPFYKGVTAATFFLELVLPVEYPAIKTVSVVHRGAASRYSTLRSLRNSPDTPVGHLAVAMTSPSLYRHWQGMSDSDPFTVINRMAMLSSEQGQLKGRSAWRGLTEIQREQVSEALRIVGIDPDDIINKESEHILGSGRIYKANVRRLLKHGSPERQALRKSEQYRRVKSELQKLVDAGNVKQHHADSAMLIHEDNAFKAVLEPLSRVDNVNGYFNSLRIELGGKEAPGGVVFRQEAPGEAVVAVGLTDVPVTRSSMSSEQVDIALRGPLQQQLRQTIESSLAEFPGLRIKELEDVAGIWDGGAENSALLILEGPEAEVRAFAAAWAVRRKQGSALIQRKPLENESPGSVLVQLDLPGMRSASEINQIMLDLGIQGGTTRQNADGTTTFLTAIDLEEATLVQISESLKTFSDENNGSLSYTRIVTEWISGWDKKKLADGSEILEINSESVSLIRSHLEGQNKDADSIIDKWKKEADENARRYADEFDRLIQSTGGDFDPRREPRAGEGTRLDKGAVVPREAGPAAAARIEAKGGRLAGRLKAAELPERPALPEIPNDPVVQKVSDLMDGIEAINRSDEIVEHEKGWHHSARAVGPKAATEQAMAVDGFETYSDAVSSAVRQQFGDAVNVYGLMTNAEYRAWVSGDDAGSVQVSLRPKEASVQIVPRHSGRIVDDLVLVHFETVPENIIMRDGGERTFVLELKEVDQSRSLVLEGDASLPVSNAPIQVTDIRAIMNDIGMSPDDPVVLDAVANAMSEKRGQPGKRVLETMTDAELNVLAEKLLDGKVVPTGKAKKVVSKKSVILKNKRKKGSLLNKFWKREIEAQDGVPKTLLVRTRFKPTKGLPSIPLAHKERAVANVAKHADSPSFDGAGENERNWGQHMANLSGKTKDNLVLTGPKKLFEWVENPQAYVDFINDGVEADGGAAMQHAREGLELTDAFSEQFRTGQVDANTTGLLAFWGFLSRGVSPYPQEAGFIDGVFSGVEPFIDLAVRGEFDDVALARYLDWAKGVSPKGGDTPGSGVLHNINAFGKNFLKNMGKKIESGDHAGKSKLALFHEWLGDSEKSGTQIRRDYMAMAEGAGLGTKVISFILMLSGRKDVIVLDRWMIRFLWDADNPAHGYAVPEIYEGYSGPSSDSPDKKVRRLWFHPVVEAKGRAEYIGKGKKRRKATDSEILDRDDLIVDFMLDKDRKWSKSRGLSSIVTGTRWLAVQEAIEHKLQQILPQTLGRITALRPDEINLATFHWLTWNTVASQGAAHASLQALLRRTMGHKDPFLGAYSKEGRYRTYDFGLQYINLGGGRRRYLFTDRVGEMHILTPDSMKTALDEIRRHASVKNVENRVVPHGFKVTDDRFPNIPWRERPSVNADNLEAIFRAHAEPKADSEAIDAAAAIARGYVGASEFSRRGLSLEDDPNVTLNHTGKGEILGQFEWNSKAGRGVIRFFENANETTLFHENAHALVILMGRAWRDRLVKQFDSAEGVDRYGRKTGNYELTRRGHEQAAESLAMYWLTRTASPAGVNKMFDQLYLRLRELWATIRGQPLTEDIRPNVRKFWDDTLRVEEAVSQRAEVLTHSATKKSRPRIRVANTPQERVLERAVEMYGKKREAARIDMNPEHVRQALGLTYETYRKSDGTTGRRIAQREVDALEVLNRAVAYVVTESARKGYSDVIATPLVRLTARSMVPEERVKGVHERVKRRLKQAVGVRSSELSKNTASTRPGSRVEVVNRPNIDPFYEPWYRYEAGDSNYLILSDRQAAGFKTLVHEVASNPIAKGNISDRLLQQDGDFRLVPINDYNTVLESLIDAEAGAGARATGYALRIPPTLGYALVNVLKGAAAKVIPDIPSAERLKYWFTERFAEPDIIGDELIAPPIKEIIEQTIRELNDIPNWLKRVVRETRRPDGTKRTVEMVFRDVGDFLIPPVKLDHARRLVDMHNDLKGVLEVASPGAEGKEFVPLTRKALNGKLNDIQGMLHDGPGMSDMERGALTLLRTYERVPSEKLTPQDLFAIGDAVSTIADGLRVREDVIKLRAQEIAMSLEGTADKAVIKNLTMGEHLDLYESFFTGDFLKLFDMWANKGRDVVENYNQAEAVLEMFARMRANNIIARLSRRMVEAEYLTDARSALKDRPDYPRFGYDTTGLLDRIDFYIHQVINWDQYVVHNKKGRVLKVPAEPTKALYSMHELAARRQDPEVRSKRDIVAYNAAFDILNKWGFKIGKGTWEKYLLPDGTEALLPVAIIKEIEDAVERAATIGLARISTPKGARRIEADPKTGQPNILSGKRFSRSILSDRVNVMLDDMPMPPYERAKVKIGDAIETMFGLNPLTASGIRLGVTVGIGVINAGYYTGVAIGTALAVHQTQGSPGFLKSVGNIPIEAGRALVGQPGIIGAVMGRMWKEGMYSPEGPALVTKDGRIYTTAMLTELAMREGLKGSFIMAETAKSMAVEFQDLIKAEGNPNFLKKMAGVPKWWLQTCIEVVTAFDNYFRIGIFIDEISQGKTPKVAADRAKVAAFDYSALSDFERTTMRFVLMFYSYMRKNVDLFYDTMLRNPERILAQLRLLNGFHSSYIEGEEEIVLAKYLRGRLMPFSVQTMYTSNKYQSIGLTLPPINIMDVLGVGTELFSYFSSDDEVSHEAFRMLVNRTTPWVQAPFVLAQEMDLFYNRDLDRLPNQVPPWLVEWDLNVTGGVLYRWLEITPKWAEKEQYEDSPGRMIYRAENGKNWWIWRNLMQVPPGGRSMDTISALDRSNIGAVEFITMMTHEYAELVEPLYKKMGWLADADVKHPVRWDLPDGDWRKDTMLPRADMMAIDEDGNLRPTEFSWIEFAGFLGLRAKYIEHEDQAIDRLFETKRFELEASIARKRPITPYRE